MKSYKDLLNEASCQSKVLMEISPEDLKALKSCIIDIYKKVYEICDNHGLTVMMAEGSCLGAVRHKGFIPWDDDMDVMMPRPDYERFIDICENGALGEEFEFRYPQGEKESSSAFMKIYMRDTYISGLEDDCGRFPKMVFLDIFPIEGMPSGKLNRKMKGIVANVLRIIGNTVMESNNLLNDEAKQFYLSDPKLNKMMKRRRQIGKLFSFISHQKWVRWYDKFVSCPDVSGLMGIPTARKLYDGETLPSTVYLPPVEGSFEGLKVWLPADSHRYLENLYGNYTEIPPVEKRERHFIKDIKLPEKYYENL